LKVRRGAGLLFALNLAGGCSFVLDPDELVAARLDLGSDTADSDPGDDGDGAREMPEVDDGADGADGLHGPYRDDSTGGDLDVEPDDGEDTDGDDSRPEETVEPETIGDALEVDGLEPDTVAEVLDDTATTEVTEDVAETDSAPAVELIVATSGGGDCTLDYYLQEFTSCPKTCGWSLVFDARASRGVSSFSWRFEVGGGYLVTPETAVGAVASVVVSTPACLFFPAGSMRPAVVRASVSADGAPWVEAATIPFAVRQVTTCGPSLCEAP